MKYETSISIHSLYSVEPALAAFRASRPLGFNALHSWIWGCSYVLLCRSSQILLCSLCCLLTLRGLPVPAAEQHLPSAVLYCREGTGQVMKAPSKHGAWNWGLKVQPVLDQSRNSSFSQSDSPADAFFFLQTLFPEETLSPVG